MNTELPEWLQAPQTWGTLCFGIVFTGLALSFAYCAEHMRMWCSW